MGGEVLAIDFDRESVKAVVVKQRGRSVVIKREVDIPIKLGAEYGPAIDAVLAALDGEHPRRTVAVTTGARSLTCELSMPVGQAKKLAAEKLEQAARWEAEPYLEFPAAEGLFSVTVLDRQAGGSSNSATLQVSAVSRESYSGLKSACKARRLKLQRVYAADSAFAYSGVASAAPDGLQAFVSSRNTATIAVMKRGPQVIALRNVPAIVGHDPSAVDELVWAIADTIKDFAEASGQPERLILTDGAEAVSDLAQQLERQTGVATLPWNTANTNGVVKSEAGSPGPQFAMAVGAALQELGLSGSRRFGVDDRVPVTSTLKAKMHFVPIILVLIMISALGSHYVLLRSRVSGLETQRLGLEDEKKTLQRQHTIAAEKEKELAAARERITLARREIDYLRRLAGARPPVVDLLQGLGEAIPDDVVLAAIEQKAGGEFLVSGCGLRVSSISAFVAKTQQLPQCEYVTFEAVNEIDAAGASHIRPSPTVLTGDKPAYSFTMSLRLKTDGPVHDRKTEGPSD